MKWLPPSLLLLGVTALLPGDCFVYHSTRSLRHLYMSAWEPHQSLPQFSASRYEGDHLLSYYDSETREWVPHLPWRMEQDPQYWEGQTQMMRQAEESFRVKLQSLASRYNQSEGYHILQYMEGCELSRDGQKRGYAAYGYDGKDFISFDKENLTWIAADAVAEATKKRLDAAVEYNLQRKVYLEEECVAWLQESLNDDKMVLISAEPPRVTVTSKVGSDGPETLICQVYGFYPKQIEIRWRKKGQEISEKDSPPMILAPNLDDTYYTWSSIDIDPKDKDHYHCHVEHITLPQPLDVGWEKRES
nr:major histocompatibility complex class I-related gene protein-like [Pogona vitticeps]